MAGNSSSELTIDAYKGAWDVDISYSSGQTVSYGGNYYTANTSIAAGQAAPGTLGSWVINPNYSVPVWNDFPYGIYYDNYGTTLTFAEIHTIWAAQAINAGTTNGLSM